MPAHELFAVILAGGSGTRFWPLSREQLPKQLLPIVGDRSMLALTLERALALVPEERVRIVTIRAQAEEIRRELAHLKYSRVRVIEEPSGRNTAPAIGLAAVHMLLEHAHAIMAVFPADHYIAKAERFTRTMQEASKLASEGWLVTLGVHPSRPETGYGYIRRASPLTEAEKGKSEAESYRVGRFTEKPDLVTAREYVAGGEHYWNSGIFIWQAQRFLGEVQRHLPEHHEGLRQIADLLQGPQPNVSRMDAIYAGLKPTSVDYGIMEHAEKVAVIPADIGWNDVGSWEALRDILPKDASGNLIQGDVLAFDTTHCLIRANERLVATLGVDGLIIVDTPDALLVCRDSSSQEVRRIPEQLRQEGREEALIPRQVLKPWGAYRVLLRAEKFQVKEIDVDAGQRLSLQSHRHRAEHWVVTVGSATMSVDGRELEVPRGGHIHVPAGSRHRVENRSSEPLRFIEVQTGDYLGEDDIVRYEDDYGRV